MNILITGGLGYIGTNLVHRLNKEDDVHSITVLDNLSRDNYNFFLQYNGSLQKVELVKADILDSRTLENTLKDIDIVYHLAAKVTTPFADQDPHLFEQVNHWGTANLAYAVEQSDVSQFIYLSSSSVYGSTSKEVDESSSLVPKTYYGISKLNGEKQVKRLESKIDTFILRSGNVYGYNPSVRFDAVINKFMFEANFFNKISIYGTGEQTRAFIHIDQITDVLAEFIFENSIPSGTYNVVSDNWSVLDISRVVKNIYPNLEIAYVNQDLKLRQLKVDTDLKLNKYIQMPSVEFEKKLKDFKKHFVY
jgi:UDP-glucose 4-epimerase